MVSVKPGIPLATPIRTEFSRPSTIATSVILLVALAAAFYPTGESYEMANQAAWIMGGGLALGLAFEAVRSLRNGVRTDVLMLVALFGLVYAEFLLPQPYLVYRVSPELMEQCLAALSLGFAGIALGRHWRMRGQGLKRLTDVVMTPRALFYGIIACAFLGYLHMLLAVNFNPMRLVEAWMGPRFSQPWGRGRYGGWADLLNELGLLINLIPPAAGVVFARRSGFPGVQRAVVYALLAMSLFMGFASGTRNVFIVFTLSFLGGYVLTAPHLTLRKIALMGGIAAMVILFATQTMLEFRRVGLDNYLQQSSAEKHGMSQPQLGHDETFFVDNNLYTLSRIVSHFPDYAPYLGLEVPYWAVIKPVPRAIWPSKPKGLSVAIEQARSERGAAAATWAATFVGEAYMAGGNIAVFVFSFLFGILAAWWNSLLRHDGDVFRRLLYASGLFAALISMRSMFWFTTGILPTIALIVYGRWFLRKQMSVGVPGER